MSRPHGSKISIFSATDTPESASDRRRAKRVRLHQKNRRELRDVRQQLRDCARLLSVTRTAAA